MSPMAIASCRLGCSSISRCSGPSTELLDHHKGAEGEELERYSQAICVERRVDERLTFSPVGRTEHMSADCGRTAFPQDPGCRREDEPCEDDRAAGLDLLRVHA